MKLKLAKRFAGVFLAGVITVGVHVPERVFAYGMGEADGFASVSSGFNHTMVVTKDGKLLVFESITNLIDDGTFQNRAKPTEIMGDVIAVDSGFNGSAVIKADKSLWILKYNFGNYNTGISASDFTPVKVMDDVEAVSVGDSNYAVIKTDGSLWLGGISFKTQTGGGMAEKPPAKFMNDVVGVSLGTSHSMAIKTDGSLWAWGANERGEIGDGTSTERSKPVKIMDDVVKVTAGSRHTLALKADGSLWAWGWGMNGVLGTGTDTDRHSPVEIMRGVDTMATGLRTSYAIKTDGSLWAWGQNDYGEMGNGTASKYDYSMTPVKVMSDMKEVVSGGGHAYAVDTKGVLYGWGFYNWPVGDDAKFVMDEKNPQIRYVVEPQRIYDNVLQREKSLIPDEPEVVETVEDTTEENLQQETLQQETSDEDDDGKLNTGIVPAKDGHAFAGWYKDKELTIPLDLDKEASGEPVRAYGKFNALPLESTAKATATAAKVLVDGTTVDFQAYNIGGNNYFKIRDIAAVLNGTQKQFAVGYNAADNVITLSTGEAYTAMGTELENRGDSEDKIGTATKSVINLNGSEIYMSSYNIDGSNYVKLRDLGAAINFNIGWDGQTGTISLSGSKSYKGE